MEENKVYCPHCGKEIDLNLRKKKFCSDACRTRYNALKYYKKVKDSPDFKKYRRTYFKKWLATGTNRDRYNAKMRIASLKWRHKNKPSKTHSKKEMEVQK